MVGGADAGRQRAHPARGAVDGGQSTEGKVEDAYSFSKLAGEELQASYTRAYGMRTYAVRAAGYCIQANLMIIVV